MREGEGGAACGSAVIWAAMDEEGEEQEGAGVVAEEGGEEGAGSR